MLQTFNYQDINVRTVDKDGEPWFIAADVCKVLDIVNATQAVQRLDEDERSMFNIGRAGMTNIVNEYGLYNLVLASRKPQAKEFKRWVRTRKHIVGSVINPIEKQSFTPLITGKRQKYLYEKLLAEKNEVA